MYREAREKPENLSEQTTSGEMVIKRAVLYKHVRKRFSRNKTIVFDIDELWQMDLCDTSSLKQFNNGDTFILRHLY